MWRESHGRARALDARVTSKGTTPTLETTKQDKKRKLELETARLPHGGTCKQPHTGSQIERPTPEPTRFKGQPIPSKFSAWTTNLIY